MICPNCGKANNPNNSACPKCRYDMTTVKAAGKYCPTALAMSIIALTIFVGIVFIAAAQSLSQNNLKFNVSENLTNIIIGTAAFLLLLTPLLLTAVRIRIVLSQGRLYGYKLTSLLTAVFVIAILYVSAVMPATDLRTYLSNRFTAEYYSQALEVYIKNHKGILPRDAGWTNEVRPEQITNSSKPAAKKKPALSFAINSNVAGRSIKKLPDEAVIAFETSPALNEDNEYFSSGIREPDSIAINNGKYTESLIICKNSYGKEMLNYYRMPPWELKDMNWMNTAPVKFPEAVHKYLSNKATARMAADVIVVIITIASLSGLIFFFTKGWGWRVLPFLMVSLWLGCELGRFGRYMHHNLNPGLQTMYITAAITAFTVIAYSLCVLKMKSRLSGGYFIAFISAAAPAAGIMCAAAVHLLFMLINLRFSALILAYAIGWGIAAGIVMGLFAKYITFRRMLVWQPCNEPQINNITPEQH